MVNLITITVACVSVWYEATPPNAAAAGFGIKRERRCASLGGGSKNKKDSGNHAIFPAA